MAHIAIVVGKKKRRKSLYLRGVLIFERVVFRVRRLSPKERTTRSCFRWPEWTTFIDSSFKSRRVEAAKKEKKNNERQTPRRMLLGEERGKQ